jgi:hypothetical protein
MKTTSYLKIYLFASLVMVLFLVTLAVDASAYQTKSNKKIAVCSLKDSSGREYQPINWDGSPPGGHHRSGVLEFSELAEGAESITLVIREVANVPERVFNWTVER